jgi:hypothetical protein
MAEKKATMYWALASFAVVALSGLAGSFSLRVIADNPNWDPGPVSFYLSTGSVFGLPAGLFAGFSVTKAKNTIERVLITLLCAAGAAFLALGCSLFAASAV